MAPSQDARTLVFVFGTLKRGFPNSLFNQGRRLGAVFHTRERHPLYLVGPRHVPWMIDSPGSGEHVAGEVYEVDATTLAGMDLLEGVGQPDGYHRKELQVGSDDEVLLVQAYMKHADQLLPADVQLGPLAEYTLAHAALYRRRDG